MTPQETTARKEALGLSNSELARQIGVSHTTVNKVLKEEESGVEINRSRILEQLNEAMDLIEEIRLKRAQAAA